MNDFVVASRKHALVLSLIALSALLVLLVLTARVARADGPQVEFLGETNGVAATTVVQNKTASFKIQMHSSFTETVTAKMCLIRVTDADGKDLTSRFDMTPVTEEGIISNSIRSSTVTLSVPEALEPGTYTATLVLTVQGKTVPPVETKLNFIVPAATLGILNDELIVEFNRSDLKPTMVLEIKVSKAQAENLEITLKDVKKGTGDSEVRVVADSLASVDPQDLTEVVTGTHNVTLTFDPEQLPEPGTYSGTVVVKADNASEAATKTFTLIVREPSLVTNPESLHLQRCWPDIYPDSSRPLAECWRVVLGFLGCGAPNEGLTLLAAEEGEEIREAALLSTSARDAAGRPIPALGLLQGGNRLTQTITITHQPQEIGIDLQLLTSGAGVYTGTIRIDSPDLAASKDISVVVKVRHLIFFPLLVIASGVLVGYCLLRITDPENNPHLARIGLLNLQHQIAQDKDLPKALREAAEGALKDADLYLRARLVGNAKASLQEAENLYQEYRRVRKLVVDLRKVIREGWPGWKALTEAQDNLNHGKLDEAETRANTAKEQYASAEALLARLNHLSDKVEEHIWKHSKCATELEALQKDIGKTQEGIVKPDFDVKDEAVFSAEIIGAESRYDKHLEDCHRSTPQLELVEDLSHLMIAKLRGSDVVPDVVDLLSEWADARKSAEKLVEVLGGARAASILGDLVTTDEVFSRFTAIKEKAFYVKSLTGDSGTAEEPMAFEVWESVAYRPDRRVDSEKYKVSWSTEPKVGDENIEVDEQGTITFPKAGKYEVQATAKRRGDGDRDEVDTPPCAVKIEPPKLTIECTPEEPRAESPVRLEVTLDTEKRPKPDLSQRNYQYTWEAYRIEKKLWVRRSKKLDKESLRLRFPNGETDKHVAEYTFPRQGKYKLEVSVKGSTGENLTEPISRPLKVGESELDQALHRYRKQQRRATGISLGIACLGGIVGVEALSDTFGSLQQYIIAFLWGAGVNVTAAGAITGWDTLVNRLRALWEKPKPT